MCRLITEQIMRLQSSPVTSSPARRHDMIGSAIERGSLIVVFDQHGMALFSKAKGSGPHDGLIGFTGSTVTVRFGSVVHTYDEKGMTLYAKAA
jgi:hypothetical protein